MSVNPIKLSLCQLQIGGKSGLHRRWHLQTASYYSPLDFNQLLLTYLLIAILLFCFFNTISLSLSYISVLWFYCHYFLVFNWTIYFISDCGAASLPFYRFIYTYSLHKTSNEYNTKWDVKKGQGANESSETQFGGHKQSKLPLKGGQHYHSNPGLSVTFLSISGLIKLINETKIAVCMQFQQPVLPQTNFYCKSIKSSSKKGLATGTPWINLEPVELLNELLIANESKAECN